MTTVFQIFALGAALALVPGPVTAEVLVARTSNDIVAIDLETGDTIDRFPVDPFGDTARGLEWDGEEYWVSDAGSGDVWRAGDSFKTADIAFSLPAGNDAVGIALVGSTMFVNGSSSVPPDTLFAVDPTSGTVLARHPVPETISTLGDLAEVDGQLWGVNIGDQEVWRIDTLSGEFIESFPLPSALTFAIAGSGDSLLIVDNLDHTVSAMDPTSGSMSPVVVLTEPDFLVTAANRGAISTPAQAVTWTQMKRRFGVE